MKQRFTLVGILFLWFILSLDAHAQLRYSLFGGVNVASLRGDDVVREEMPPRNRTKPGVGIGFSTYNATLLNFRFELVYCEKGARYIGVGDPITHALTCIEVPALIEYRFDSNDRLIPKLFFGPYFSVNLRSEIHSNGDITDLKEETMKTEAGLMLGVGVDCFDRFEIMIRYSWSIRTIHRDQDIDIRTRNVQVFTGILL